MDYCQIRLSRSEATVRTHPTRGIFATFLLIKEKKHKVVDSPDLSTFGSKEGGGGGDDVRQEDQIN